MECPAFFSRMQRKKMLKIFELGHDKTYNKTCVTNKNSDQSVHPPSMVGVLVYPSLDNLQAVASGKHAYIILVPLNPTFI